MEEGHKMKYLGGYCDNNGCGEFSRVCGASSYTYSVSLSLCLLHLNRGASVQSVSQGHEMNDVQ